FVVVGTHPGASRYTAVLTEDDVCCHSLCSPASQSSQPREADVKFLFTSVPVKSEEDDEEQAQCSQLHENQTEENGEAEHLKTDADGEDCGGPEPARNSDPERHSQPDVDDENWEETGEPHCSVCKTMFSNENLLLKHMTVHTGEKPFGCPVCRKRFTDHSNLKRHLTLHTGERPFKCSVCSKRFAQKGHLKQHATLHTREKQFSCSVCSKRFSNHSNLRRHLTLHTGEKPFSCPICSKNFAQRGHLKQHLPVHTGEKPFSCPVCSKTFTQKHHQYVEKHKCHVFPPIPECCVDQRWKKY
uniref:C2H2-type domain-containing protein n=1 Tax=Sander lucioperca TaxID=283035 RepID=A0A8C9X6I7_SANLU